MRLVAKMDELESVQKGYKTARKRKKTCYLVFRFRCKETKEYIKSQPEPFEIYQTDFDRMEKVETAKVLFKKED